MTPGHSEKWIVVQARDGGRPFVYLLQLDSDAKGTNSISILSRAEPGSDARSVAFAGTYEEAPRDGYVVVLVAPGIERVKLTGDGGVTPTGEGLAVLPFNRQDPNGLSVELYTSSLVGTETPAALFRIVEDPSTDAPDALDGADPRALGWEPRVYERPVGLGCHRAVFCGQLDVNTFGVLFARSEAGGKVTVKFLVYRAKGGQSAASQVLDGPVEVVAQPVLTDPANPRVFLLAQPGVTRFRVQDDGMKEVLANEGWAWTAITRPGGGIVTAFDDSRPQGQRIVGSGTF